MLIVSAAQRQSAMPGRGLRYPDLLEQERLQPGEVRAVRGAPVRMVRLKAIVGLIELTARTVATSCTSVTRQRPARVQSKRQLACEQARAKEARTSARHVLCEALSSANGRICKPRKHDNIA